MKRLCHVLVIISSFLANTLLAENLIEAAGSTFTDSAGGQTKGALSSKVVCFYFSACWCPPCKTFTPKLAEFYSALKQDGQDIEIVFVSFDKTADAMTEYMKEMSMPWLAVPYNSKEASALKRIKSEVLESKYIPMLVVLKDGQIITKDGRKDVESLGSGAYKKWASMTPEESVVSEKPKEEAAPLTLPPPEKKEMKLTELKAQMLDFDGKVVKVSINHVYDFEQISAGKYRAWYGYFGSGANASESVLIPEEGKEFFQEISKQDNYGSAGKSVYLLVRKKNRPESATPIRFTLRPWELVTARATRRINGRCYRPRFSGGIQSIGKCRTARMMPLLTWNSMTNPTV